MCHEYDNPLGLDDHDTPLGRGTPFLWSAPVGSQGRWTEVLRRRAPRTIYKRSKNVFAVTSIALSCAHIWARLLQPFAQSLTGIRPVTFHRTRFALLIRHSERVF